MGAGSGRPNELSPITTIDTAHVRPVHKAVGRGLVELGSLCHGPTGPGSNSSHGGPCAWTFRSVHCCALPAGRPADVRGHPAPRTPNCARPPPERVSAG